MAPGRDPLDPQPTASGGTATGAPPAPQTLDPLVRALDRAVIRSAQAGPSGSRIGRRD